ncbi:hypothetical protein HZH66_012797 [Vespula vulgaris]|uniref:Uncharacterized protein n=1 Tax=Vespula vulgaris TaxID=7454 RepID=A0A834MS88_VESVU|nr:hypothetical protein HZH66_012797 [Vespula vulgaris]
MKSPKIARWAKPTNPFADQLPKAPKDYVPSKPVLPHYRTTKTGANVNYSRKNLGKSPAFTNVPPIPKSITDSVELCRLARDPGIYTGLTLNTSHRGEISSRGNN